MGQNIEWKKRQLEKNVEQKKCRKTSGEICPCPRPRPCPCPCPCPQYLNFVLYLKKKMISTINNYAYSILITLDLISSRHFFPFDIMSHSAFLTFNIISIRRFVPFDILSFRRFFTIRHFVIRQFVPFDVLSFDVFLLLVFFTSTFFR